MDTLNVVFGTNFWYIAPILVAVTTGISGLINQGCKIEKAWVKQLISWVVSSVVTVGAWSLQMMTFSTPVWLGIVSMCVVVGLASNGFYDIPTIKNLVKSWFVVKVN